MKNLKLKKLVAMALTLATVTAVSPMAASAAWKQDARGWWNTKGDSWSTGWDMVNGTWYHFDSTGYMETGWVNDGGTWYFMDQSGAMKTGWVIDYSAGYGQWYFMDQSGAMKTGWVQDKGTWYFMQPSGAMKTGWVQDKGTWYFTSVSGAMQTGVVQVDGKVYYLAPSGAMLTGEVEIKGVKYTFAVSGEAIGDKIPTPDKIFSGSGILTTPNTGSTGNSGSTTTDSDDDKTTSGGGGGGNHHGGGNSSPSDTIVTYTVTFDNDLKKLESDELYASRDLYVTNADGTNTDIKVTPDGDNYLVEAKSNATITGVTRVVKKDGTISFIEEPTTKTKQS